MSTNLKIVTFGALIGLVAALVSGVILASTHVALGTFLWGSAIMLGPFAGIVLFVFAALAAGSLVQRSLSALGGVLLLASVGLMLFTPIGATPDAMFPMYVVGGLAGATAVGLNYIRARSWRR